MCRAGNADWQSAQHKESCAYDAATRNKERKRLQRGGGCHPPATDIENRANMRRKVGTTQRIMRIRYRDKKQGEIAYRGAADGIRLQQT